MTRSPDPLGAAESEIARRSAVMAEAQRFSSWGCHDGGMADIEDHDGHEIDQGRKVDGRTRGFCVTCDRPVLRLPSGSWVDYEPDQGLDRT